MFFSEKKLLLPLQSALGLVYFKTEDNTGSDIDSSDVGGASWWVELVGGWGWP